MPHQSCQAAEHRCQRFDSHVGQSCRVRPRANLFKAVMLRHDCFHRNGFDKDGNELTAFTKALVRDTADLIKGFVENIENAVRARSAGTS